MEKNIFRGAECVALDVDMLVETDIKFLFQFLLTLELILHSIEREIFGFSKVASIFAYLLLEARIRS